MSPSSASLRKQSRQSANFRRYARGRPQRLQRFLNRTLNFGVFASLAIFAVVAMLCLYRLSLSGYAVLNGIPSSCSSFRDSSSVFAVVTTEMFIPRALSTFM
jgi:hypothetical protein